MIKRLQYSAKLPIHTFLVGLYFILFVYTYNMGTVELDSTFRITAASLLLSASLYFVFYKLLKSKQKAGVYTSLLLFGVFSYGIIYNNLEDLYYAGIWPLHNIHRYLVISYLVIYTALLIFMFVTKRTFMRPNHYLNILLGVLLSFNIFQISLFEFRIRNNNKNNENPFISNTHIETTHLPDSVAQKFPDVYYIILDGYANQKTLLNFYKYDNSKFLNYIKSRGFYIAENSTANYPVTSLSLSSSLNMNYLNDLIDSAHTNTFSHLISRNLVSYYFKHHQYKIVHVSSGYNVTRYFDFADKSFIQNGPNEFERSVLRSAIFRLDDLTGFMAYLRLTSQFRLIKKAMEEPSPKFTFIHIVCPHPPFVFNRDGTLSIHSISDMSWAPKENYVNQLVYVNQVIKNYIDEILYNSTRQPIIVLQSDHGPWMPSTNVEDSYSARNLILNAYLVPNELKKNLYQTITPVNSFRIINNYLFNDHFPPLDDQPIEKAKLLQYPVFMNYIHK